MTLFDLAFLLAFLSTGTALLFAIHAFARGRRGQAGRIVARTAIGVAAYFVVILTVSIASPQRRLPPGQPQCSDDWCITVDSIRREARDTDVTYTVGFELTSRARRVAQRERFVVAYVQTGDGRRIEARPESITVPFDTVLQAGQSVTATRRFVVSRPADGVGVVVAREGGFRFPRCCIIGDEGSLLHQHTLIVIDSGTAR